MTPNTTTPREEKTLDVERYWAITGQLTPHQELANFISGYVGKLRGEMGEKTITFTKIHD
jgi:hypothetical protein